MTKDLATLDINALSANLAKVGEMIDQIEASSAPPLLRFTRDGTWVVGAAAEPVPEGTPALVHLDALRAGYIAWKAGRPEGEVMKSLLLEGPVDPTSLPPTDAPRGWEPQVEIGMTLLDDGLRVTYKSSSVGGRQVFVSLLRAIHKRFSGNTPPEAPVVELGKGQYSHPDYGVIYTPKLTIADWRPVDGNTS